MGRLELLISESLSSLKVRLELLISENRHLRDLLANKNREVQCLSLQVSEAAEKMKELCEERRMLLGANQEKYNVFSLFEAKEREHKQQLESMAVHISKVVAEFECRVTQDISGKCSRLKNLSYQLCFLKQKANVIVRRGLLYQQRLEKKCSDLEKAEAEVDLLGDKVETLLSLVEKIHIALDHYSPVLKHYPGITEILKLLRRELTGETKAA